MKINTRILTSALTIVTAGSLMVGAAFAYFSSNATSSHNNFTAGTLNINLSNGSGWSDGVTDTWSSPANWAPGDEVIKSIYLKNTGTIPAMAVYAHWNNLQGNTGMANVIQVTWLSDSTDINTNNIGAFVTYYDNPLHGGNGDGKLELAELVNGVGSASTPPPNQARFYEDSNESYTNPVLPAGGTFEIRLGYKFMETAGNEWQGQSVSFDLTLQAAQHPYNH